MELLVEYCHFKQHVAFAMSREEVLDVFTGSYSQVEPQNEISGYTNKITEMINFFENGKHRMSLIPVEH